MTTSETLTHTEIARSDLTGDYDIDPSHSRFGFVARHAMVTKVRGQFNDFEGTLRLDGENSANSEGRLVVQAKSIDTRSEDRYLFLEALMAARDAIHISHVAEGASDGQPRAAALPLAELLGFLDAAHGIDEGDAGFWSEGCGTWSKVG